MACLGKEMKMKTLDKFFVIFRFAKYSFTPYAFWKLMIAILIICFSKADFKDYMNKSYLTRFADEINDVKKIKDDHLPPHPSMLNI